MFVLTKFITKFDVKKYVTDKVSYDTCLCLYVLLILTDRLILLNSLELHKNIIIRRICETRSQQRTV